MIRFDSAGRLGSSALQTMWLAWAASLIPLGLLSVLPVGTSRLALGFFVDWVVFPFLLRSEVAVAAAIGIAVLRYRLYAIELSSTARSSTWRYVPLLGRRLRRITVGLGVLVGGDSPWVVAPRHAHGGPRVPASPRRIQDLVDRRYRRARYEGVRRVRSSRTRCEMGGARRRRSALSLPRRSETRAQSSTSGCPGPRLRGRHGESRDELPDDERARSEIERDDARTAVLAPRPGAAERRDLLDGVVSAAALSIEMARLRVEVRLQLAEVEASRARIVEAGLRGAAPPRARPPRRRPATARLARRPAQAAPADAPARGADPLPGARPIVDEVGAAIADLRQIAAGVRPARLDDGLAAALRDLARTSPIPVDVDVGRPRRGERRGRGVLRRLRGVTNAVKHASASHVR